MALRPAVRELVQLFPEVTKGTPAAATARLLNTTIEMQPDIAIESYRGSGYIVQTGSTVVREAATGSLGGALSYEEALYIAASVLRKPVTTQPDAVGNPNVYDHLFEPSKNGGDDYQTYSIENGQSVEAERYVYGAVTGWNWEADRMNAIAQGGAVIARAPEPGFTLTTTGITERGDNIVAPNEWDVFIDNTAAGLGTTQLLNAYRVTFEVTDRRGSAYHLRSDRQSFDDLYESVPGFRFTIRTDADATARALYNDLLAGQRKFARFLSTGPNISGTYNREIRLDAAGALSASPQRDSSGDLIAIEFGFNVEYDPTWGKFLSLRLRNNIAAVA